MYSQTTIRINKHTRKSKKKKTKVTYGVWIVVASAVNYNICNFKKLIRFYQKQVSVLVPFITGQSVSA